MRHTQVRNGCITAIVLATMGGLSAAPAASAQETLSDGCQLFNQPALDGAHTYFDSGQRTFSAGERITVSASDPSSGDQQFYLSVYRSTDSGQEHLLLKYTDVPGTTTYTIPTDGIYDVSWGDSGVATYAVSCVDTAPDCSSVIATPNALKADGKLQRVTLSGATDPEGEAVTTYAITGVTQDEPTTGGFRNDLKTPDAGGVSGNTVSLRGERNPTLNGRVYRIHFTATDASGFDCSGYATAGVPARRGVAAVDDGDQASWNSFTGALVQ